MRFRVGLLALWCATLATCGLSRPGNTSPAELKFTIPNTRGAPEDLILDGFLFDGGAVRQKTLQVKTLSPGVHEITADAPAIGEWVFAIRDLIWHTSWINQQTSVPGEGGFKDKIPASSAANFADADKSGYFLHRPDGTTFIGQWWKGRGGLIDFTNPAAKKWWQGQVAKAIDAGADGFKDDDAEGNFIGDVKLASGEDVDIARNRYAVDYNRAVAEILAAKKR
jgi:Glycosyl hydrolases family 31